MGTNSSTTHLSYSVAPTAVVQPPTGVIGEATEETAEETAQPGGVVAAGAADQPQAAVQPETPAQPPQDSALALPAFDPAAELNAEPTGGNGTGLPVPAPPDEHLAHAQQLLASLQHLPPVAEGDDLHARFEEFRSTVADLDAAVDAVADPQSQQALRAQMKAASVQFLTSLEPNQLQAMAQADGFAYPGLVGLSGTAQHPLVHWLDPAYPADSPSKAKIQAAAQARFDALCAGETVGGKTLAEWKQADETLAAAAPAGWAGWQANAADVVAAQAAFAHAMAGVQDSKKGVYGQPTAATAAAVAELVRAENRLATAHTTDLDDATMAEAVAAARHQTDQALSYVDRQILAPAVGEAVAAGTLQPDQLKVLNSTQVLSLLRASTPAHQRADLEAVAAARLATLNAYQQHVQELSPYVGSAGNLPALAEPAGGDSVAGFLAHTKYAISAAETLHPNKFQVYDLHALHDVLSSPDHTSAVCGTAIKQWAAEQPLPALRAFAKDQGLDPKAAEIATKSQIGNYLALASGLHTEHDGAQSLQQKLVAKWEAKHAPPTPVAHPDATTSHASPGAPNGSTTLSGLAPVKAPTPGSVVAPASGAFAQNHANLVAALQHAHATQAALPGRLDAAVVGHHDFGAGKAAYLGGVHPKTLHTGPDGSTWLAKPDARPQGAARVHAEATASQVLHRAGLPAVPVYAATIGGTQAAVQPLLSGATTLDSDPASWSQADVDAIVRMHVGAWAVGDHDGKPDNVLRTSGGGLVGVDGGQAYRHYGRDRLSMEYHPNSTFGAARPVYQQAYAAHLKGKLAPGVTINPAVAHPIIKQFEAIPDAEYRAMHHQAAHAGASLHKSGWAPAMRARAAQQHGISEASVSTHQIADAFLDHVVERKNTLRAQFADFFASEVHLPAAQALKHMGG